MSRLVRGLASAFSTKRERDARIEPRRLGHQPSVANGNARAARRRRAGEDEAVDPPGLGERSFCAVRPPRLAPIT